MKRTIMEMAQETLYRMNTVDDSAEYWTATDNELEAFAKLVAAHTLMNIDPSKFMSHHEGIEAGRLAEREAAAKEAEAQGCHMVAVAIRARGQA